MSERVCRAPGGCSTGAKMATSRLCWTHYQRNRRFGRFTNLPQADFWSRVARTDGCWPWMGIVSGGGYGALNRGGRRVYAHRVAYELSQSQGPIPDGMTVG